MIDAFILLAVMVLIFLGWAALPSSNKPMVDDWTPDEWWRQR